MSQQKYSKPACLVPPNSFEPKKHFYERVLNATMHPLVHYFLRLGNQRIIQRFCHINPSVSEPALRKILSYNPKFFKWAGSDLFNVTTAEGQRQMVIVETNSCPSGQKSMPLFEEHNEEGGYKILIEHTFAPVVHQAAAKGKLIEGALAVIFDKNKMEASGYAASMADVFNEPVYLVEFHDTDPDPSVRYTAENVLEIRDKEGIWHPIRAAFRYVTQKPWNRLRICNSKTIVFNPIIACLAGGRNKMVAAKAYDFYNAELSGTGLSVKTPETFRDLSKTEIPLWVQTFGGHAVVKVPYANAGQGVYTITSQEELHDFMNTPFDYEKFIVQSLIGNSSWSSTTRAGQFFHVGTVPNRQSQIFVADIRMMVTGSEQGFRPLAIYARRANEPLSSKLTPGMNSWAQLGTNLSVKKEDGTWDTETDRLILMDRKDFNTLGVGVDDLIDAYIQTVLSVIAIDKLCERLMTPSLYTLPTTPDGTAPPPTQAAAAAAAPATTPAVVPASAGSVADVFSPSFNIELFSSLNDDQSLLGEITI